VSRAHATHGTRSRGPAAGLIAGTALVIAVAAALVGGQATPAAGAAASPAPDGSQVTQTEAAALYLQNCASCHGPDGQGATAGPSLIGVGAASMDFYLRTGRMPLGAPGQRPQRQEPFFNDAQIRALTEYVVGFGGEGPGIPEVPQVLEGAEVHRGWELYTANCAACHAATGAGNAVGGGNVAYGLGNATPVQVAEAMLIGPGVMPRFQFDDTDRDAILAYIQYLQQDAPSPGGAAIGGFGPVAEGFVAVVLGLTLLVLVARFVGRQSHEGEPDVPLPGETGPAA
jgi:ubiquinol-cytochrome c reductase cytochrome c subunit